MTILSFMVFSWKDKLLRLRNSLHAVGHILEDVFRPRKHRSVHFACQVWLTSLLNDSALCRRICHLFDPICIHLFPEILPAYSEYFSSLCLIALCGFQDRYDVAFLCLGSHIRQGQPFLASFLAYGK